MAETSHGITLPNGNDPADYEDINKAFHEIDELIMDESSKQTAALNAEVRSRTEADNTLQGNINIERDDRINANNMLQNNIDTERIARTNADNSLQTQITENKAEFDTNKIIVNQEILRVEDIALGANVALSFANLQQLNNWFAGIYTRPDGKTPNDLRVGNLMLLETENEPDFWWTGTYKLALTEKIDLSEYAKTVAVQEMIDVLAFNVLQKDNVIPYEPTQNYHPATKKYVDALLNLISGLTYRVEQLEKGLVISGDDVFNMDLDYAL